MNIQDIQYLRQETGAGIMDCKNILIETDGDIQESLAILRQKGFHLAQKKAERTASDGIAYAGVYGSKAVLVEVNTETDFVAGNSEFIRHVEAIAKAIAEYTPNDLDSLMQCVTEYQGLTVSALLQKMVLTFDEKMVIRRFNVFDGDIPIAYMHQKGTYGVILSLVVDSKCNETELGRIGKELGMQIAAMAPLYICRSHISDETRADIAAAIVQEVQEDENLNHKSPQVLDKVVAGRIEKYFLSKCLMEQAYIRDDRITVNQFLQRSGAGLGVQIDVSRFCRYERAEGLHNKEMSNIEMARQMSKK